MKEILPISIIIPVQNEEKNIERLLRDIQNQTHSPSEIIVADANSEDNTVEIAKKYGAKVIQGGIPSVGRNNGLKKATEDIIMFLDADINLIQKDFLKIVYSSFEKYNYDYASCLFKPKDEKPSSAEKFLNYWVNFGKKASTKISFFNTDSAAALFVRKAFIEKIGGFDERIMYVEDVDLVKRMAREKGCHGIINCYIGVNMVDELKGHTDRNPSELRLFFGLPIAVFLGSLSIRMIRISLLKNLGYKLNHIAKLFYGKLGGVIKYENPYRPKDRDSGYPKGTTKTQRRFFEILQGFLFWFFLLLPIILGLLKLDVIFVLYVAFLASYWSVKTIKFVLGVTIGTNRMNNDLQTDWMAKIRNEKLNRFNDLRFIYLCPVYGEDLNILEPSFEAFVNSDIGAEKIDVVMAIEEKRADFQKENFKYLKEKYGNRFGSMHYYIHPAGIQGEIAGVKGANINWATRHFVEDLKKQGKKIEDYLLVTCDSDLRPHRKYLSAITYKYLTVENPDLRYYATAVHTYENNIWKVPGVIRAQSNMLTMVLLYGWVFDKKKQIPFLGEEVYVRDSFSSYVVNLKTLHDFEYWDPEIANDDTAFYWNAMVRSKGKFKSEEVYIPTYNDAVENETTIKSYQSFYKQQHRWGWGSINVPITLAAMSKDRDNFPWYRKLAMFNVLFEYQIWYLSVIFVLTFGLNIMGWLSPSFQFTAYAYNLPKVLTYIFTVITIMNIPLIICRRKIVKVPKGWSFWRQCQDILETFLITVNMLTFGFIPYLQAKTEIMLGKASFKKNFYVTDKVKIKKDS